MRKSMWISFVFMMTALAALPVAYARVDSEKSHITVTEEILCGDPAAAEGVTLQIGTETEGHLAWNTEYTVGNGGACEVRFDFFHGAFGWTDSTLKLKSVSIELNPEFQRGFSMGDRDSDTPIDSGNWLLPRLVSAVAGRTKAGEEHSETVRLRDYYEVYPMNFSAMDWENRRGFYSAEGSIFGDFFHIAVEEDMTLRMTVKKNDAGEVVFLESSVTEENGGRVSEVSAFGEDGCYYAYNYEDSRTGKCVDRGQNSGIFYISMEGHPENSLLLPIAPEQVKKVCELPENTVPVQMLLDEEARCLYLMLKGENDFSFVVYGLEDGGAVQRQRIPVLSEEMSGGDEISLLTCVRMTMEEGGILAAWENRRFSFLTEEGGQWRQWCADTVRGVGEEWREKEGAPYPVEEEDFYLARDMKCSFDGERLALAGFVLPFADVQLHVYKRDGLAYSGVYRHSGSQRRSDPALWGSVTNEYGTCMYAASLKVDQSDM